MEDEYSGHWITTYTGKKFHFLDPQPEEINIADIAHALSLTCRFGGQCKKFYSVAEHSIRTSEIVSERFKLLALLHDASEAYMPDLPRPIKASIPEFKVMERVILVAVWKEFRVVGWFDSYDTVIKEADDTLLATEARDLMANMDGWAELPKPLDRVIIPMSSKSAEVVFLHEFNKLMGYL